MLRIWRGWSLAAGLLASPAQACAAAVCPDDGRESAVVAAVESRLELRLADGRMIRMAGLDPASQTPADPDLSETARARLATMLAGKPVTLMPLAGTPDRWGRIPALAFVVGARRPGGLAAEAIATGLGRYLAEPAAHACREALIAAERDARSGKLGLWADPYYAVLAVDDHVDFTERSATIVLAEGQLAAVEPSPYRTTLRFAASEPHAHGGHMLLVATIPPRVMKTFDAAGVKLQALIGRRLRFRGLLDLRFGPKVELVGPDALEADLGAAGSPPAQSSTPIGSH